MLVCLFSLLSMSSSTSLAAVISLYVALFFLQTHLCVYVCVMYAWEQRHGPSAAWGSGLPYVVF